MTDELREVLDERIAPVLEEQERLNQRLAHDEQRLKEVVQREDATTLHSVPPPSIGEIEEVVRRVVREELVAVGLDNRTRQ